MKHNSPYISKEVWNNMAPDVRKLHIEGSKKGRQYQQIYGSQHDVKLPANDHKNQQRNKKMGGTTQEGNKPRAKIKTIKNNSIRTMKTTSFGFQPWKKMNMSIRDTRYVDETKLYTNKNQYKVTEFKDNIYYINSVSDAVGIGGDAWVIEEVSNRTVTISG